MGADQSIPWWEQEDSRNACGDSMSEQNKKAIVAKNEKWPHGQEEEKYNNNGISPDVFGPCIWDTLSLIARNYPVTSATKEDIDNHHNYLLLTGKLLPCVTCRKHCYEALVVLGYDPSVHLRDRQSFSRFINALHNHVNKSIGKREFSYEEHREKYYYMIQD